MSIYYKSTIIYIEKCMGEKLLIHTHTHTQTQTQTHTHTHLSAVGQKFFGAARVHHGAYATRCLCALPCQTYTYDAYLKYF